MNKIIYLVFFSLVIYGQSQKGTIKGRVLGTDSSGVCGANIFLLETSIGTNTDIDGFFIINNVPFGNYLLKCRYIGYSTLTDTVELSADQSLIIRDYYMKMDSLENNIILIDNIGEDDYEEEKDKIISGYYTLGFQYQVFTPCDSIEPWRFEPNADFDKKYRDLMDIGSDKRWEEKRFGFPEEPIFSPTKVYCVLKGNLIIGKRFYAFMVKEVLKMELVSDKACNN